MLFIFFSFHAILEQLESVRAASRRSLESDSEYSEARRASRPRRRGSRPSSRTTKHERIRSVTAPAEIMRATSMKSTDEEPEQEPKEIPDESPSEGEKAMSPQQDPVELEDQEQDHTLRRSLRRMPSDVSVGALRPLSTAINSPITPTLTTGTSVATDDDDADFQSAYSTSPRGSYSSFDNVAMVTEGEDSDVATPTTVAKEYMDEFGSSRERASSTATARIGGAAAFRVKNGSVTVVTSGHSHLDMR